MIGRISIHKVEPDTTVFYDCEKYERLYERINANTLPYIARIFILRNKNPFRDARGDVTLYMHVYVNL